MGCVWPAWKKRTGSSIDGMAAPSTKGARTTNHAQAKKLLAQREGRQFSWDSGDPRPVGKLTFR